MGQEDGGFDTKSSKSAEREQRQHSRMGQTARLDTTFEKWERNFTRENAQSESKSNTASDQDNKQMMLVMAANIMITKYFTMGPLAGERVIIEGLEAGG